MRFEGLVLEASNDLAPCSLDLAGGGLQLAARFPYAPLCGHRLGAATRDERLAVRGVDVGAPR